MPSVDRVSGIYVSYVEFDSKKMRKFEVPREHWARILSTLSPAELDSDPPGLIGFGGLELTLVDHRQVRVLFYVTLERDFELQVNSDSGDFVYCRGLDLSKIEAVLNEAYEASQQSLE